MIVSDFWLGVILTIAAEAIITILVVDYLGQKEIKIIAVEKIQLLADNA